MEKNDFFNYLKTERKASDNTAAAYVSDVAEFTDFVKERGLENLALCPNTDVVAFLMDLRKQGKSKATVNRKLSSVRTFYKFLIKKGDAKVNPTDDIKAPKIQRKKLEYLTVEQVERLLDMPGESSKGLRDKAILEVMYGTGIRVSELIELTLGDVNLRMGFITCDGHHGRARIVPLGSMAREALEKYLKGSRKQMLRGRDAEDKEGILFPNYMGEQFTRQGLWKIMKAYAGEAGIADKFSPIILRTSFAVHMVQNGADVKSLQELMGLEDISAAQVYLSVTKNRIKDVYDKTHPRA